MKITIEIDDDTLDTIPYQTIVDAFKRSTAVRDVSVTGPVIDVSGSIETPSVSSIIKTINYDMEMFAKIASIKSDKKDWSLDIVGWVETYCLVRGRSSQSATPPVLYPNQRRLLNQLATGRNTLIVSGRQNGVSACLGWFAAWKVFCSTYYTKLVYVSHSSAMHRGSIADIVGVYERYTPDTTYRLDSRSSTAVWFDSGEVKFLNFKLNIGTKDTVGQDTVIFENADYYDERKFDEGYIRFLQFVRATRQIITTTNKVRASHSGLAYMVRTPEHFDVIQMPCVEGNAGWNHAKLNDMRKVSASGLQFVEEFMAPIDYYGIHNKE